MMIKISYLTLITICTCLTISCSSELDFDQIDDAVVTPQVDVDVLFFTLETESFIDVSVPDTTFVVRDMTRFDFLRENFVRENVKEIEFSFQVDNSFLQSFNNRFVFLNETQVPQYTLEFIVEPSLDGTTTRTSVVERVNENELEAILNSSYIANELQLNANEAFIEGEISFQSKALFSLAINDF